MRIKYKLALGSYMLILLYLTMQTVITALSAGISIQKALKPNIFINTLPYLWTLSLVMVFAKGTAIFTWYD